MALYLNARREKGLQSRPEGSQGERSGYLISGRGCAGLFASVWAAFADLAHKEHGEVNPHGDNDQDHNQAHQAVVCRDQIGEHLHSKHPPQSVMGE